MIDDIAPLLKQSVSHQKPLSLDRHGQPDNWSEPQYYPARVTHSSKRVTVEGGDIANVTGEIWMAGTPSVSVNDRINLPDGSRQRVLKVETYADEYGPHHVKVYF